MKAVVSMICRALVLTALLLTYAASAGAQTLVLHLPLHKEPALPAPSLAIPWPASPSLGAPNALHVDKSDSPAAQQSPGQSGPPSSAKRSLERELFKNILR